MNKINIKWSKCSMENLPLLSGNKTTHDLPTMYLPWKMVPYHGKSF